jgi:hypothetical protein
MEDGWTLRNLVIDTLYTGELVKCTTYKIELVKYKQYTTELVNSIIFNETTSCTLQGQSMLGLLLLARNFIYQLFRPVIDHLQGNNQHGTKRRIRIYDSTSFRMTYLRGSGGGEGGVGVQLCANNECKIARLYSNVHLLPFIESYWSLARQPQWPRGLKRRSTAARQLRSWVRIAPGAWKFCLLCVFCVDR